MGRLLEVRQWMVRLNRGIDFVSMDDILVDLKLTAEVGGGGGRGWRAEEEGVAGGVEGAEGVEGGVLPPSTGARLEEWRTGGLEAGGLKGGGVRLPPLAP